MRYSKQEEETRKKWAKLPPLEKHFYEEHPDVTNMTAEKVAAIREANNNITVDRLFLDDESGGSKNSEPIPNPIETFGQCFAKYPDLMGELNDYTSLIN